MRDRLLPNVYMAEENIENTEENVDLNKIDEQIDKTNKVEDRIKDLSHKVKTTSEERDKAQKSVEELTKERDDAKKETEFYTNFSAVSDKYPDATEFKDDIKEKVNAGYSMEDAAVAILVREGKYKAPTLEGTVEVKDDEKTVEGSDETPAGGSAVNPSPTGEKTIEAIISDGTQEEKRAALIEEEKKGNLGLS